MPFLFAQVARNIGVLWSRFFMDYELFKPQSNSISGFSHVSTIPLIIHLCIVRFWQGERKGQIDFFFDLQPTHSYIL